MTAQGQPLFPIVDGKYTMDSEPIVRIGVILPQDAKKEIQIALPVADYRLTCSGSDTAVSRPADGRVIVRLRADHRLDVLTGAGVPLREGVASFHVQEPHVARTRRPGDGILVKDMVSGRGFHWSKLIDQTLPGHLHFTPSRDGASITLVNELPLEEYLTGVITSEMSGDCPIEFMKAQAIAARSWLLGQPVSPHPGEPYHWCNDDCCQRYQGTGGWSDRAIQAIAECRAETLITRSNHYCDARYSKSTGGISEDAFSVWGYEIEGLTAMIDAPPGDPVRRFFPVTDANVVEYITGDWVRNTGCFASPNVVPEKTIKQYLGRVDEVGEYFRWTVKLTPADLRESMTKRAGLADLVEVTDLRPGKRGRSGRLETLDVSYVAADGSVKFATIRREYHVRAALSVKFLFSSCVLIDCQRNASGKITEVILRGAGWGHGAGLCQIGGLGRALKGQKYDEILLAYYSDVRLERIYP